MQFHRLWIRNLIYTAFFFCFFAGGLASSYAQESQPLYPGFTTIKESAAYRRYVKRVASEQSKILYLIDRFAASKIEIDYDGYYLPAKLAAHFARLFVMQNYEGQTAEQWVHQWCHRTILRGNPIYVKLPDGSLRLGREVLFEELGNLSSVTGEAEAVKAV